MGKMSLTSCHALSTPGKFSNVDRYVNVISFKPVSASLIGCKAPWLQASSTKLHFVLDTIIVDEGYQSSSIQTDNIYRGINFQSLFLFKVLTYFTLNSMTLKRMSYPY